MATTIRWLHLSDFHVGKDQYEQVRLFDEIVKEVDRWKNEKNFAPDYVFITGDIANKGLKKEYEAFRSNFLTPLQEKLTPETVVFPVPGNHDVERPGTDTLERGAPLAPASRFFDANKEGKTARDQALPRFSNYKKLMSVNGMSPDWLAKNDGAAVHMREVAGVKVGVVGLNTAWLCKDDQDKDKLTPGYRLAESALKQIASCPIKIVLGHHPLSWWHDSEEEKIRGLFAEHHVIYLHGHKHKAEGRFEEGGVDQFLVLQSGAAFQAREGDKWVNGFSWGELDPVAAEIRVSPWRWVNREWRPDVESITLKRRIDSTDWWRFPVPGKQPQPDARSSGLDALPGWRFLDAEILRELEHEVEPAEAQVFFDGAEPDWSQAMSPHFPVREQAQALLKSVVHYKGSDRPQIALIRGPTAEGKSMALRQIVAAAMRNNRELQVLWHQDETTRLSAHEFQKILTEDKRWLIATDHGDMVVKDLAELAQYLKRAGRSNVQFVIAAHDSDWKIAKGNVVLWYTFSRFEEAHLSGLSQADAMSIASAWLHFGASANDASIQNLAPELLANRLHEAAKSEGHVEGAFFGALLTLRHGRDLRAHVQALIKKFDSIRLSAGGTVGNAFRLIAAMHAEDLDFLSTRVLQEVMGCDGQTLKQEVLRPMAVEAAIGSGSYVRTRHRGIARAALEVCGDAGEDWQQLYLSLAEAAIRVRRIKGEWLQELANWEYALVQHFFDTNRKELAIRIAEKFLATVPDNSHYAVNLAQLKRETGDFSGAIQVLQSVPAPNDNRGFWCEWGTACGMLEDYLSNAVLYSYSISDQLGTSLPSIHNSELALAGLAKAFEELHIKRTRLELHKARAGCAWLGLLVCKDAFSLSLLKQHRQATVDIDDPKNATEGISWLRAGLAVALSDERLAEAVEEKVSNPLQFEFEGLQRLLGAR